MEDKEQKIKKVMIATPCHDRKLPVEYVSSLLDTMRAGFPIIIATVFLPGESMLPHARNYLADLFLKSDFDSIFYIDSDMTWSPEQFASIAMSDKPIISGLAHLKTDNAPFNFRQLNNEKPDENGLMKIESIGCAFIKIDRKALEDVQKSSSRYIINDNEYSSIFEYSENKNEFVSEDITFCRKLTKKKYSIFADTKVIVGHIGSKIY